MPVSNLNDFYLIRYGQGTTYKLRLRAAKGHGEKFRSRLAASFSGIVHR